jgi:ABC-type bacteriocin/lantibiotic exporter with double-glycine peptidase domain
MNSNKIKNLNIYKLIKILIFFRKSFIIGTLLALFSVILHLPMPLLTKYFIDEVIPKSNFELLHIMGIALFGVLILSSAVEMIRSYITQILSEKISMHIGTISFGHIQDGMLEVINNHSTGYWLNRIQIDPKKLGESFNKLNMILTEFLTFIFGMFFVFLFSLKLGILISILLPFYAWSFVYYGKKIKFYSNKLRESNALLAGFIEEAINGIEIIKALVIKNTKVMEIRKRWEDVIGTRKKLIIISQVAFVFSGGLASFAPIIAFWYGGYLVMKGLMTLGELVAINRFLSYIFGPIRNVTELNAELQDTFSVIDRFEQIKNFPKENMNYKNMGIECNFFSKAIIGNNIDFYYQRRNKQIFNKLNFSLPLGKFVAIVGKSGAGKSTLLKLLVRFFEPDAGDIKINGEDINSYNIDSFRKSICIVPQNVTLFSGTLRYNILLNREIDKERLEQILYICQLQELIDSLKDGLNCELGPKGMHLSGGQRQKIALARALCTSPQILLMDEFTSEIDVETESLIIQELRKLRKGKTTIVVAHRLASIKDVDEILVFSDGQILERGNHHQLLELKGHYFSLYSNII